MLPNWFSTVEHNFERFLTPWLGLPDLHFLQIGAYAGHCTEWLCRHVLTGDNVLLVDIDTWQGSADEAVHSVIDWHEVQHEYWDRVHAVDTSVHTFVGESDVWFTLHGPTPASYDFIYIDAGHRAENVLRDGVHADYALKPGGILAFDDYGWWENEGKHPAERPKAAVDAFFEARQWDYDILTWGYQVWLQKRPDAGVIRGA